MAGSQVYRFLRAIFLLFVFLSIGCSSTTDRKAKSFSVNHSSSDNIFCTISAGVWNCDSVTPKTPIQKILKKSISTKKLDELETQNVSRPKKNIKRKSRKITKDSTSIPVVLVTFDDDSVVLTKQSKVDLEAAIKDTKGYNVEVHSYIYPKSSKQEEWLAFDRAQRVKAFLQSVSSLTVSIKRADRPYAKDSLIGKSQVAAYLTNTH